MSAVAKIGFIELTLGVGGSTVYIRASSVTAVGPNTSGSGAHVWFDGAVSGDSQDFGSYFSVNEKPEEVLAEILGVQEDS